MHHSFFLKQDLPRLNAAPVRTITRTHIVRSEAPTTTTTETVTLPAPAGTLNVKPPMPAGVTISTPISGPTHVVERVHEQDEEPLRTKRRPKPRWFPVW